MSHLVGLFKIEHNQVRALSLGLLEQGNGGIDTLFEGEQRLFVIVPPIVGHSAWQWNVACHPIDGGGFHPLSLSGNPNWFAAVERGVVAGRSVAK